MLQPKGAAQAKGHTEQHGDEEGKEKDADSVEEGRNVDVFAVETGEGPAVDQHYQIKENPGARTAIDGDSLVHDDRYRVVQYTLAKDNRVQLGVDLGLIEDGEDGNWVCGREGGSKDETLKEGKLEAFETEERPDVHQNTVAGLAQSPIV